MRQAWKSWLIYVVVRRTKLHMQTTALEFRQRSVLCLGWSRWRRRLGQAHVDHTLLITAVQHRALSLQLQAWSRWQEQLLCSQRARKRVAFAVRHHQCWQKRWALKAWLKYLHICRVKRQRNEMAVQFHRVTVLQLHFCDWQWAWEQRQSLSACQALVEKLGRRMVLRRVFIHWKHYLLLRAEEAAAQEAAAEHRRHTLLYFCFRALKDNVAWAHLWRVRKNLAHQQYDVTLLRRFWNLWLSCMEQREEREQLASLHEAWNHYRVTLLRRCIRSWLQYAQERRRKQLLQARADGHFQRRALPVAFHTWSRLWRRHQQDCALTTRAARFHRETVEKQVFAIWWHKMFQHRENRLAERMAILQAERQLLRRSWITWHQLAASHHQEREWQAVACTHHHHGLLRKAFSVWWESAQGVRTERMGRSRAVRFHSARLLRWAWSRWRECLTLKAEEWKKLMRADLHGQRALLHRALRKWLTYQDRVRSVLREVAARESQHNRQLLRWVLHRWRDNTMARLQGARKNSQASAHYQRTLCSKVLVQWQEVASVQTYYRQQEAAALREARKVLDRGCLRRWFLCWKSHSQRAAHQRAQLEQAAQHHRQQLLLDGLAHWKAHHLGCTRKKLLTRIGAQFLAQRLCRTCFYQWRQQATRQEQRGTAQALWFWALSLQAKVWAAWLSFVLERRRKKARLEWAARAYHRRLQQEGVTRLLRFTAGMKAFRQQLQTQQQVQLWKKKVLGPGRDSQLPAPITSSRRVTFEGSLLSGAKAEDAFLETKRLRAPRPQGSLALAAGEPHPLDNAARSARKPPRRPPFLLEPGWSQRSQGYCVFREQGPEKPREWHQGTAQPAGLSLMRPFLPRALPSAPVLKLHSAASPGLELLPPSSFMPPAGTRVHPCPIAPLLSLLPESIVLEIVVTLVTTDHTELEAELEGIHQQLQHYQTTKWSLWSCQRQASSLRRWLELSQEEPGSEDQDVERQVQKELEEVELQIQQLAKELQAQRQPIGACIARIQALRQALC
uniref:Sfi1 homolog, spindle assembly associated (yeast) n=1 Tax=Jaculus jaculus TaxID=51337 RepID=A0A8C5KL51_JACJA